MRARILALVAVFVVLLAGRAAAAHGLRSAFVEVDEVAGGQATIHLRVSVPAPSLVPRLDDSCRMTANPSAAAGLDRAWATICDDGRLAGHQLTLSGLGPEVSDGVVWVRFVDGSTRSFVVSRDRDSIRLPRAGNAWSVAGDYVRMGVVHILTGYDHLLFLALLVLALGRVRSVLLAETAFTLSHSISFSATALGALHVSASAAEACIALSLVLLALDIRRDGKPALTAKQGAGMAFVFGLVHGLGFAGGLREIGVPDEGTAWALLGFGAGVEIGQVAFLVVLLAVAGLSARRSFWPRACLGSAYAIGAVATFWLIERVALIWKVA